MRNNRKHFILKLFLQLASSIEINNILHAETPAESLSRDSCGLFIFYRERGDVMVVYYFTGIMNSARGRQSGKLHRKAGPAV